MMIRKLPESLSSRIAAGEVIERPVSVVKELLENALDAGATRIDVRLFQGGKTSLTVEDNGRGIPFEELPLAVERYATSKLGSLEDLYAIRTLGYRGEALASIALVSKMEITSRVAGQRGGVLRVKEGVVCLHEERSCAEGTSIRVEDLFCSIPGRKKFLKSGAAESRRIAKLLREYALAYPEVGFMLFSEGKTLLSSFGDGNRTNLLAHIWGDSRITECFVEEGDSSVRVYHLSKGHGDKSHLVSFVNGRRCEDPLFFSAVKAGSPRPGGEWLFLLQVPESHVDVNVHPAKIEVRFRDTREVFRVLQKGVQRLGGDEDPLELFSFETSFPRDVSEETTGLPWESSSLSSVPGEKKLDDPFTFPKRPVSSAKAPSWRVSSPEAVSAGISQRDFLKEQEKPEGLKNPGEESLHIPRFMGRLASGYLLFDNKGALVIMDPHAAHERVEYENVAAACHDGLSQRLLAPLELPPTLGDRALEHEERLEKIGFVLSQSDQGVCLTGLPESFQRLDLSPPEGLRLALGVMEEMEEDSVEHLWKAWAFVACKRAVKLTDFMGIVEALELWRQLFSCKHPGSCPHGRPTILSYSPDFLEKEFHRR